MEPTHKNPVYVVEEAELVEGEFKCVQIVSVSKSQETARSELKKRVNYIHKRHEDLEFNIFGKNGFAELMFKDGPTYRIYTVVHELLD